MPGPDGLEVSRRQFLVAAAVSGSIVSGSGRTVSQFTDSEEFPASLKTGELDLDVYWEGNGGEMDLGVVSEPGDGGERRIFIELTEDSNPAWLWFRTGCPLCLPIEELITVEYSIRVDGEETPFETFSPGTLREAREQYGTGHRINRVVTPGETWILTITWELTDEVAGNHTIDFGFDFFAVQQRHFQNSDAPSWECDSCPDESNGDPDLKDISWAAFAGDPNANIEHLTVEIDGSTLEYDIGDSAEAIQAIGLKYGQTLEVFENVPDAGSVTVGEGDVTYAQQGNGFEGTNHTNSEPFPDYCWTAKIEAGSNSFEIISECEQ